VIVQQCLAKLTVLAKLLTLTLAVVAAMRHAMSKEIMLTFDWMFQHIVAA
jgi:hypothetical protein